MPWVASAAILSAFILVWSELPAPAQLLDDFHALRGLALSHQTLAAAAFVLVYAVLVGSFLVPASFVLSFAGGILFGGVAGGLLSIAGATIGATIAFRLVTGAMGTRLLRRFGTRGRRLCRQIRNEGVTCLVALRLAPFLPFAGVTIAASAARLRTSDFVLGTAVGTTPATLIYAGLGDTAAKALAVGGLTRLESYLEPAHAALLIALACGSLGFAVLRRRWTRALARA
jgi:uncharacterized membrane protein YdjX (TVP38/TMEM64 family)